MWYNFKEPPNKNYNKFYDKIKLTDNIKINDWNLYNVLGYFCKKYYNSYNAVYNFRCNTSSPTKSTDYHIMNVLCSKITKDPVLLKQYIDWLFDEKLIPNKKRITSITILNCENYIEEFKNKFLFNEIKKIKRSDILPSKYLELLSEYEVKTYGDLAFLYLLLGKNSKSDSVFKVLTDNGFDINLVFKVV